MTQLHAAVAFSLLSLWPLALSASDEVPVIPVREREVWFRDAWVGRVHYGAASDKTLGEITSGQVRDHDRNRVAGVSIGRPIVEDFRDWPIDFEWRIEVVRFLEDGERDITGHKAYLKAYWKGFPWSRWVRTRLGFGEGISYAWRVLRVEREEARKHDRNTSRLLNYLDVSIDLNAGDLFRARRLDRCWLGFLIDHRSGAFGLIDIFGRANGGSNYNSGYLECTF